MHMHCNWYKHKSAMSFLVAAEYMQAWRRTCDIEITLHIATYVMKCKLHCVYDNHSEDVEKQSMYSRTCLYGQLCFPLCICEHILWLGIATLHLRQDTHDFYTTSDNTPAGNMNVTLVRYYCSYVCREQI